MNHTYRVSEQGSTLVTVTVVMTVIAVSLAVFLRSQSAGLPSFTNRRDKLQAIANSRSAAIKGLQELLKECEPDTSAINDEPLFEEEASPLWDDSRFGTAEGEPATTPFAQEITVVGEKGRESYSVTAEMRSSLIPNDTVVILCVKSVLAAANISGTKAFFDSDTAKKALPANIHGVGVAKKWMQDLFDNDIDIQNPPKTVTTTDEFATVKDTVHGPLFLAPISSRLRINGSDRTIFIDGDLQLTGNVTVEDITFIVAGEVRLNDNSNLKRCNIYSKKRVFVADETSFSGRLASLKRIEIYGSSKITDRSLVVSFSGKVKSEKSDTTASKEKGDSKPKKSRVGAINIREQAVVDASCITLGKNGILTEMDSKTTGILWSRSWIRHEGTHKGLLRALLYKGSDNSQPVPEAVQKSDKPVVVAQPTQQEIIGAVETLFEPAEYPLPWFIGEPRLMKWSERNAAQ